MDKTRKVPAAGSPTTYQSGQSEEALCVLLDLAYAKLLKELKVLGQRLFVPSSIGMNTDEVVQQSSNLLSSIRRIALHKQVR